MKKIALLAGVALVFAACSKDDNGGDNPRDQKSDFKGFLTSETDSWVTENAVKVLGKSETTYTVPSGSTSSTTANLLEKEETKTYEGIALLRGDKTTVYEYNGQNLISKRTVTDNKPIGFLKDVTVGTYQYDGNGRLTYSEEKHTQTHEQFGDFNQTTTKKVDYDSEGRVSSWVVETTGNLYNQVSDKTTTKHTVSYNGSVATVEVVVSVTDKDSGKVTTNLPTYLRSTFDGEGRLTQYEVLSNGKAQVSRNTYKYDGKNNPKNVRALVAVNPENTVIGVSPKNNLSNQEDYDENNKRTQQHIYDYNYNDNGYPTKFTRNDKPEGKDGTIHTIEYKY